MCCVSSGRAQRPGKAETSPIANRDAKKPLHNFKDHGNLRRNRSPGKLENPEQDRFPPRNRQRRSPAGRAGNAVRHPSAGPPARGGAGRDRTDDLKLAKLPLSQLSYGPLICLPPSAGGPPRKSRPRARAAKMVGPGRLELPTSRLSGVRSNQLSYGPESDRRNAGSRLLFGKGCGDGGRERLRSRLTFMRRSGNGPKDPSGISLKGGDPAAGSPTATLLRLHPSR